MPNEIKTLMEKTRALETCKEKKCPKENKVAKAKSPSYVAKVKALATDLLSKKITLEQYNQKTQKILAELTNSPEIKKLADCIIRGCKSEFTASATFVSALIGKEYADKIKKLLAKKNFDVEDYLEVGRVMMVAMKSVQKA
jgi:hypothetical protein